MIEVKKGQVPISEVISILVENYGINVVESSVTLFPSYDDQNVYFRADNGHEYVFKIHSLGYSGQTEEGLALQDRCLAHLHALGLQCPNVHKPLTSASSCMIHIPGAGNDHKRGRLLTYIPGTVLANVEQTPEVLEGLGRYLGEFTKAMESFPTDGARKVSEWDQAVALQTLAQYGDAVACPFPVEAEDPLAIEAEDAVKANTTACALSTTAQVATPTPSTSTSTNTTTSISPSSSSLELSPEAVQVLRSLPCARRRAELLQRVVCEYSAVMEGCGRLEESVIHSDANDYNLIVSGPISTSPSSTSTSTSTSTPASPLTPTVTLIDYGDLMCSARVFDLAISLGYLMLDKDEPLQTAKYMVKGYLSRYPLTPQERAILIPVALTRVAVSVTMSAYNFSLSPDNFYVLTTARPGWRLLSMAYERWGGLQGAQRAFEQLMQW